VIQSELNRLFEEYWHPERVATGQASGSDIEPGAWTPAIDIYETADEVVVVADLPGVDSESIDVSVTGSVLTLRGDKPAAEPSEAAYSAHERLSGPFSRQVNLSSEVNFEAAKAEARHGVLTVRLPKKEASRPRTIRIQTS
jgi:HSP20 family protein